MKVVHTCITQVANDAILTVLDTDVQRTETPHQGLKDDEATTGCNVL